MIAKKKPRKKPTRSLTILQKRCCDIYHSMKKPCKQRAYKLAGSTTRGKTAKTEAHRMMELPHVKAYLDSLKEAATERAQRTADEIIAELEKIGFSNIKDYLDFGPKKGVVLKDSKKLTPEQLAAIESISETTTQHGGTIRFKLHDKPESLHLLGKRHGLFPNRQELTGKGGGPVEVTVVHFDKKKR